MRAVVGAGPSDFVLNCYRELAVLCAKKRDLERALVVGLDGDPHDHFAVRDAMRALAVVGVPPDFKLALCSDDTKTLGVYSLALSTAKRLNIYAKVFSTVPEAIRWLDE